MLKHSHPQGEPKLSQAATFGWLCVETLDGAFGEVVVIRQPPSGGCVLKQLAPLQLVTHQRSHLRVAVC